MLTLGVAMLALTFGAAAMLRGAWLFTSGLSRRRAVQRLYRLVREETTQRRLYAVHGPQRLAA